MQAYKNSGEVLSKLKDIGSLSGNTLRVSYHLCIRHTLGTVFELHQSSENVHSYFYIIKTKICIGYHMQRNIIVF